MRNTQDQFKGPWHTSFNGPCCNLRTANIHNASANADGSNNFKWGGLHYLSLHAHVHECTRQSVCVLDD